MTPPSPSLSTIDRYRKPSLSQHCLENYLLRISLVLVFHRVLQLQRANNIQFGEWPFVSVALVSRGIQQWNGTQPNYKNANFFLKVKLIMFFLNGMLRHSLTFDHFLARKVKKRLTLVRQAASKTKLLIEKRERKYFIVSLTTFSCVIQFSIVKQMLWSKNYLLLLFADGTVWEHKPLLLLTKSLRRTPRISVSFIVMSCYHENDCFEFMSRALGALHWLRLVEIIWVSP